MRMVRFRGILFLICCVIAWPSLDVPVFAAEVSGASSAETIEEIDRQLQSAPWSEILLRNKAALLFKNKEYRAVIATVKPLLIRDPNNTLALEATAKSYSRLNDYGKAIDFISRLIELQPTYDSYFLRGSCRIRVGLYSDALRDNDLCIKLCPHDGRSYLQRAEIHRCLVGIDEQFEKYINRAIELSPENPAVQLDYAIALKLVRGKKQQKLGRTE